ncbi:MAG: carbohydrate ABC transporter permease [Eubacteriales bacterium]
MIENKKIKIIQILLISFVAVVVFYPVLMMVMVSLKNDVDFLVNPLGITLNFEFQNYVTAFKQMNYLVALKNSVILTAGAAVGSTLLCAATAYAIARAPKMQKMFAWIGIFFWLGLALPQQVVMVPLVMWIQTLGLGGTLLGLMLVYIGSDAAYGVFFFTGFVRTVPVSLEEAARIDGASPFTILRTIVFPLLKTPMVTLLIIMILRVYNNFTFPLILLQGKNSRTLPLTIYFFKGDTSVEWNVMFAATTLVVLPLMFIYFIFQRRIIDGMLSGSVKM